MKFLGEGGNRVLRTFTTAEEIDRAGCHRTLGYPKSKRPSGVHDGAKMLIARLVREPNDILVFGLAIATHYVPGRDDATKQEIARRSWKSNWPHNIRVHGSRFVDGTMANGVSLNELMNDLGADAFKSTQRNASRGKGNTDPRRAYMQQPAVELTAAGYGWLIDRLELAFRQHGEVRLERLYDPDRLQLK